VMIQKLAVMEDC